MTSLQKSTQDVARDAELELFVVGSSGRSHLVERNVRRVLEEEVPGRYRLTVIDVLAEPSTAEAANVSLTPTLLYVNADTPRRLVGMVHQREQILRLLTKSTNKKRVRPANMSGGLADLSPDGLVLVNENGEIIESNAAARRFLDLTGRPARGEIFGLPLRSGTNVNVVLPNGIPVELKVREQFWKGKQAYLAILRDRRDQRQKLAASDREVVSEEHDALQSAIAQASRSMAAMQDTSVELERSNKELLQFAHRAAHDLKAPALSLQNIVSILLVDEADRLSHDGAELLDGLRIATDRLVNLTESLLDFSKASLAPKHLVEVDLNTIVRWAISDLQVEMRALCADCIVGDLPTVKGVQMQYYQVFLNLIGNALKYHRPGVEPRVEITSSKSAGDSTCTVTVRDNGRGFKNEFSERIFEPFERLVADNEVPGTGIGLATVKRILEANDASIFAEGFLNRGAAFTMVLPKAF